VSPRLFSTLAEGQGIEDFTCPYFNLRTKLLVLLFFLYQCDK